MAALAARVSEVGLIERAKDGDQEAFEVIFERYQRSIYHLIYRMIGDYDDAHDLTQETFIKAYNAIGRTRGHLNVSAWLHRIASNACTDVLRRRQRLRWIAWEDQKHDHLLTGSPFDDPEHAALNQEVRLTVQRVLDKMSHRHRLGITLQGYEGLSYREIGEVMGISLAATRSMMFRAHEEFCRVYATIEKEQLRVRKRRSFQRKRG